MGHFYFPLFIWIILTLFTISSSKYRISWINSCVRPMDLVWYPIKLILSTKLKHKFMNPKLDAVLWTGLFTLKGKLQSFLPYLKVNLVLSPSSATTHFHRSPSSPMRSFAFVLVATSALLVLAVCTPRASSSIRKDSMTLLSFPYQLTVLPTSLSTGLTIQRAVKRERCLNQRN